MKTNYSRQVLRSSFLVLPIRISPEAQQEVGALGVAQGDGVEQRSAAVVVANVHLGSAETHQGFDAIQMTPVELFFGASLFYCNNCNT